MDRRKFMVQTAITSAATLMTGRVQAFNNQVEKAHKLQLGFDHFSIRALKWKAPRLLDYAAAQKVDAILFSDLHVFESHDEKYLKELKVKADELGIRIQAGTGSICPTSGAFKKTFGSAEQHLSLTIKVARALGSDVARCYLGTARDRKGPGGLKPHIEKTIEICQSVKSLALESGVKIAIENHAGDMTAYQLKGLIEKAGPDYVGATIDSGNASWTMEDPARNLEILAPYVVSSGIRDSLMWRSEKGLNARWTAMGAGHVDWRAYFDLWRKACPNVPVQLEIISGLTKTFPGKDDASFWQHYQDIRDSDYDAFGSKADTGKAPPESKMKRKDLFTAAYMQKELEASIKYCRETLGLGRKA